MKNEYSLRIKHAREQINMTQAAFAEPLGLTWTNIKDLEIGRKKLTPELSQKMEEVHNINLRWLLTGQGPMFLAPANRVASESSEDKEASLAANALREDILAQKIVLMLREVDEEDRREILAYAEKAKQAAEERARLVAAEAKIAELERHMGKAAG